MTFATSKNLTITGIFTILGVIATAAIALFDGDAATNVNWEVTFTGIAAGVGMILAKGSANTGGTVASTPEAATRINPPPAA
jgi:hypothetical protein